ncbi:MAG: extracellular solute-binding protein [Actinomycetota bacterium]
MTSTFRARGRTAAALMAVAWLAAIGPAGCSTSTASPGKRVTLVAYSVSKSAYDAMQTAFVATPQGAGVTFAASYGPSGSQSKAVANGQQADYVAFSLEPDLSSLAPSFVDLGWNSGPTKGLVSDSVVVIAVRKGNPKGILGWDDLIKPGVTIVTPDPGSSGSAKWNVLAAYAHLLQNGGSDADAQTYLTAFFANVASKPASAAAATQTFLNGTGDVLISYENEAIAARQKGAPLDYVVPAESILIENPAAVTKHAPQAAKDFLVFAQSEAGQKIFASKGFRPVLGSVAAGPVQGANNPADPFPRVAKLETVADLGGWSVVNNKLFNKADGIVTRLLNGS